MIEAEIKKIVPYDVSIYCTRDFTDKEVKKMIQKKEVEFRHPRKQDGCCWRILYHKRLKKKVAEVVIGIQTAEEAIVQKVEKMEIL